MVFSCQVVKDGGFRRTSEEVLGLHLNLVLGLLRCELLGSRSHIVANVLTRTPRLCSRLVATVNGAPSKIDNKQCFHSRLLA